MDVRDGVNRAMATSADDASGRLFLAHISHEIRNSINGVIGMLNLLRSTSLDTQQYDYTHTAHNAASSLLALVNNVLDFSKIEVGRLELENIDFDVRRTVSNVMDLFRYEVDTKQLALECLIADNVPQIVRGDPTRVRQVLANLVSNAIKFSDVGNITLRVEVLSSQAEYWELYFVVTDFGIGMSDETLTHVFDPYCQADSSTAREYGGSGLGLSISKQLVEHMRGVIGVDSSLGEGSTFWFTLRCDKTKRCTLVIPRGDFSDLKMLVINDPGIDGTALLHMINNWGIVTQIAQEYRSALQELYTALREQRPYDFLLLNKNCPDAESEELARAIRSAPSLSPLQIIMVTATGQRGDANDAQQAGIAAYLTQPIAPRQLQSCIAAVMARAQRNTLVTRHSLAEAIMRGQRILVVEDNSVNQKIVVGMLKQLGYDPAVASNGQDALQALECSDFDAVLMDVQMADMDGYQTTAAIRAKEAQAKHLPIIAMTANTTTQDREQSLASGMDDYMTKPFTLDGLSGMLNKWVNETSAPYR